VSLDQPSIEQPSLDQPSVEQLSLDQTSIDHEQPSLLNQPSLNAVVIFDSPVKPDPSLMLPQLNLYVQDREIIRSSSAWLTEGIISAAQAPLREQSEKKIYGFMSPQLCKHKELFPPVPPNSPYIQILHVHDCHWSTVSNIDISNGRQFSDAIMIYDSGVPTTISLAMKNAICSVMRPKADKVHFDLVNVHAQPNACDCGLYAIAYATELVHGCDPALCLFDNGDMRQHLLCCLEKGSLSRQAKSQTIDFYIALISKKRTTSLQRT